jgi:hypothetical protein
MEVSFSALFKKSRFYTPAERLLLQEYGSLTKRQKREHRNLERFAAAAVGFCLKHHKGFRRHFLTVIGPKNSPESHKARLSVEDFDWADLLIITRNSMSVIEFKIQAALRAHQNPTTKAFYLGKGYGNQALAYQREHEYDLPIDYVVLGCKESIQLGIKNNIKFRKVDWSDIYLSRAKSSWLRDLFDGLGYFGVDYFRSMQTKDEIVEREGIEAAKVYEILRNVAKEMHVSRTNVEGNYDRSGQTGSFGLYIPLGANRSFAKKLKVSARPPQLGWFGYEGENASIWFYCAGEKSANDLKARIKATQKGKLQQNREYNDIGVRRDDNSSEGDQEWFISVFRKLLKGKRPRPSC